MSTDKHAQARKFVGEIRELERAEGRVPEDVYLSEDLNWQLRHYLLALWHGEEAGPALPNKTIHFHIDPNIDQWSWAEIPSRPPPPYGSRAWEADQHSDKYPVDCAE